MKTKPFALLLGSIGFLLCGCTLEDPRFERDLQTNDAVRLRTEDARRIYDSYMSDHPTRSNGEDMTFFKGDNAVPLWGDAAPSSDRSMSAVDVCGRCLRSMSNCATNIFTSLSEKM